ncbi:MAG: hypothetical protein EA402_13500 [Planctomycetota bacterium]|nr:MAG: hypothetical protein EA402_13500 [Planctomycetota bacterium]
MSCPGWPHSLSLHLAAALCLLLLPLQAADWPSGVAHDFAPPVDEQLGLIEDANHARVLWRHRLHTGIGKGGKGSANEALAEGFEPTYGDTAAAIIADGLYVLSWAQASGEVSGDPEAVNHRYWRVDDELRALAASYLRIDADWQTVALDIHSGELRWQRSEPSAAMNFLSNKRDHNGVDPAAGDGVYVTVSTTGHIFAYNLADGSLRWQSTVGPWHDTAEAFKAEALDQRRLPVISEGPFGHRRSGVIIADGVAVVPDRQGGLLGLNLDDGSLRWQHSEVIHLQATPRPWQHGGHTYLVCNAAVSRGSREIVLIKASDGSIPWRHETGHNPGQLLMGDGHVLLNPSSNARNPARYVAYTISIDGLEERWAMPEGESYTVPIRADRGAERKGVLHQGLVYLMIGDKRDRRLALISLEDGKILSTTGDDLTGNAGLPVLIGDRLMVQNDSSHTGGISGITVYGLSAERQLQSLGSIYYDAFGLRQVIDYEHPTEVPWSNGVVFIRAKDQIAAIDLRAPQHGMAAATLNGVWAGFHRAPEAMLIADAEGKIIGARMELPPRGELGVVGTTARRTDGWTQLGFAQPITLGEAISTQVTFDFLTFDWQAELQMTAAENGRWLGTWQRSFAPWDEPLILTGELAGGSEGGHPRRGWPTAWLEHQPVTYFSPDLAAGQQRVFLQLHGALPRQDGVRNLTLCLDHDGSRVISGIGGGFSFNQAYHEIDGSSLTVDAAGIRGQAHIIANGDRWVPNVDWHNGGSLLGRLELDVQFGEANDQGIYPIRGSWEITWGIGGTRSGSIEATISKP